jgi:hypothetical protein
MGYSEYYRKLEDKKKKAKKYKQMFVDDKSSPIQKSDKNKQQKSK